MENKQSAKPQGCCQKVFSALGFRRRQRPPTAAATKREKEKKPITKPTTSPVVQDTRLIEVEYGDSSTPATILKRKETIKEGGEKAKEPRDINEMAESFLKRARLRIRALSGVNDGKP